MIIPSMPATSPTLYRAAALCRPPSSSTSTVLPIRSHQNHARPCLVDAQVRLAIEESLGLPEGSLHKGFKSLIKEAVHFVMVRTSPRRPTALVYEFRLLLMAHLCVAGEACAGTGVGVFVRLFLERERLESLSITLSWWYGTSRPHATSKILRFFITNRSIVGPVGVIVISMVSLTNKESVSPPTRGFSCLSWHSEIPDTGGCKSVSRRFEGKGRRRH